MHSAADNLDTDTHEASPDQRGGNAVSVPPIDIDRYRSELTHLDLSEAQEAELLRTLYFIMAAFVDLGFGVDSVTRVLPALADFSSSAESDALEVTGSTQDNDTKKGPADG